MNRKIIGVLLIAALIGASFIAVKRYTTKSSNQNIFVVGTAAGYAPFVSINAQGEYEGFDIDVAQSLAQQMGKKLVLKDLGSMALLFASLEQGSIDAIIWGMSITPERLKKVAMVNYHGESTASYPLLFWKAIPEGVRTLADMAGKTVCVEPASAQDSVLRKYPSIHLLPTEKVDDALLNIQYGKADAALVDPAIAKKFKNKYPEIQILEIPLAAEDQEHGVGVVLRLDHHDLIERVQSAVTTLKSTGVIAELERKWGV